MKKTILFSILLFTIFTACQPQKPEEVILDISFENTEKVVDTILIISENEEIQIVRDESGNFRDTMKLKTGIYYLVCDKEYGKLYLENGFDLKIHFDYMQFDETIQAEGNGETIVNHIFNQLLDIEDMILTDRLFDLDSVNFYQKIDVFFQKEEDKLKTLSLDEISMDILLDDIKLTKEEYVFEYQYNSKFKAITENMSKAPNFNGKDAEGNTVSLSDFLGKLVYIDIWASWCRPCLAESPYYNELLKEYGSDNIEFLGISLDCEDQYQDWLDAIKHHEMNNTQIIIDSCWESKFVTDYYIESIPRFILIGQEGEIIDFDAPRPSSDEIRPLLNKHITI